MTESLTTGKLLLRQWEDRDRLPFRALNEDLRVMEWMPGLLTGEASDQLMARIQDHFQKHGFGLFAAELRTSGEFLGFIGLSTPLFVASFQPAVGIGWRLAASHWYQGLATEGARAVLEFAVNTLRLPRIVSFTAPANMRSRRVMEKIGLTHNPQDDFDHPLLPLGHPLRRHVLYRLPEPD